MATIIFLAKLTSLPNVKPVQCMLPDIHVRTLCLILYHLFLWNCGENYYSNYFILAYWRRKVFIVSEQFLVTVQSLLSFYIPVSRVVTIAGNITPDVLSCILKQECCRYSYILRGMCASQCQYLKINKWLYCNVFLCIKTLWPQQV